MTRPFLVSLFDHLSIVGGKIQDTSCHTPLNPIGYFMYHQV